MYNTLVGADLKHAALHLLNEETVAIPTETVYGLAAAATSEIAVRTIFSVKRRPPANPLIVHVRSAADIITFATHIPEAARLLLDAFSRGPLTVLLPGNGTLPALINNGRPLVAFRVPAHPLAQQLLSVLPFPLVAPSANRFTTISPTLPVHVLKNFSGEIPYILDGGPCTVGVESTVVGFDGDGNVVVYRPGAVTAEAIKGITGKSPLVNTAAAGPSPGQMAHHYAPATPLRLTAQLAAALEGANRERTGVLAFSQPVAAVPPAHQVVLSRNASLAEAARNLYAALHYLDDQQLDCIFAEKLPNLGLGSVVNERLQKAANRYTTLPIH